MLPKEKWIIVKNTHNPIIEPEVFEMVQKLQKTRTRSVSSTEENGIFSGLLFCADCKHAMARKYARHGDRGFIGYICKTYKVHGKQFCSSHSIEKDALEEAVLSSVKNEARKILNAEDIDELQKIKACNESREYYDLQLENIRKRMDKIEKFKKKTYESYMEDLISIKEYRQYISEFESEIQELQELQSQIDSKTNLRQELNSQYDEWVEAFKDYINIKELTRDVVLELIDKIEVNKEGSITIYYKFQNPYT